MFFFDDHVQRLHTIFYQSVPPNAVYHITECDIKAGMSVRKLLNWTAEW